MEVYYTKDHEWIKIEGNRGTLGITEYAARQLGDITFIEKPLTDKTVKQGEYLCEIESVKAASDLYAPLSGSIKEVNEAIENFPEVVSSLPETDGWIAKMELSNLEETKNLMTRKLYSEYLKTLE